MNDRIGQRFGNYRLLRLLGSGGFADVYLGEHKQLNTQAAIKILHTRMSPIDIEKFRNEARIIARLIHPSIVRVFDFDVKDDIPFLVMDYQPNGTLRDLHPLGRLVPLNTVNLYIQQIADALQYAHDEKLVHRDIKPENMLVGRRNEVLLSDFGIAAIAHSTSTQKTQDRAGTISYMAPEQIQGKPRPASDQYALGIITYEWLTGVSPFSGDYVQVMYQQLQVMPPPLREQVPSLPSSVEQAVLRAIDKDPQKRFTTVRDFAQAFKYACQLPAYTPNIQSYSPTPPPPIATNAYSQGGYAPQRQTPRPGFKEKPVKSTQTSWSGIGIALLKIATGFLLMGVILSVGVSLHAFSIVEFILAVIVCVIAELIVGWRLLFGLIGSTIAALIGIWLMTQVIVITGIGDINLFGVPLVRALIGAIIFVVIWHLITHSLWRRRRRYYRRA